MRTYELFLAHNTMWVPWTVESCAAWLLHELFNKCLKKSTLMAKLAGFSWWACNVRGLPDLGDHSRPGTTMFLVARTLSRLGADAVPKLPIKLPLLCLIVQRLHALTDRDVLWLTLVHVCPQL